MPMIIILALCLVVASSFAPSPLLAADPETLVQRADSQLLRDKALLMWVRINEARRNPLAQAERLGVSQETLRIVFSDQLWILEQGLPPLAWNEFLTASAHGHGRDMIDRLFYSYVSPEGATYDARIAATGYDASFTGETMNALFFQNFMVVDQATTLLMDAMLTDELSGRVIQRNIFSPDVSEVGIALLAGKLPILGDRPYVYLFIADFAAPRIPHPWFVGPVEIGTRAAMKPAIGGEWHYLSMLYESYFQVHIPQGGANFVLVGNDGLGEISAPVHVGGNSTEDNIYLDLREAIK